MSKIKKCRKCGTELTESNWYPSRIRKRDYICNNCTIQQVAEWRASNPDAYRASSERASRKRGVLPRHKNRNCSVFLGVYVAENVLSRVFSNVEMMPYGNSGFDFVCNKNKKIDVKSACHNRQFNRWSFIIKRNTIADHFLCLAFDDRENLNPLHMWLLPGNLVNANDRVHISQDAIDKWDEFRLPIGKVVSCCNTMKNTEVLHAENEAI